MVATKKKLRQALQGCINAMKKSKEVGCTDHLDCCDDAGAFWYDAIENAKTLLQEQEK